MAEQVTERIDEVFQQFLRDFKDENGKDKYRLRLSQLGNAGGTALLIDFDDLIAQNPNIARQLLDSPNAILHDLELAAYGQLKMEDPEYAEHLKALKLHFRKLPSHDFIRKLGAAQIGHLTAVDGIIVRSTEVHPLLTKGKFQCRKCNATTEVEQNFNRPFMRGPGVCAHCRSRIFEFVEKESSYINSQGLRIQERPEDLPPGQLPNTINVRVIEDLVNTARPGDRVTVTAIVKAQQNYVGRKVALTTFQLELEANYVEVVGKEVDVVELTPEDEHRIQELSKDPFIHRKLIASLAPSIYGYGDIKEGVLYLIAGGVAKQLPDGMKLRGDPNILLIGEPSVAKSQLLQYVARVAPRGLYTSGRGTSAAGLTAAVLREKTGGMVLEAGALVLADKGVACIDELDKMKPEDRVALHEALEQHTVSVAKAGIVATLNARAAVLAAANPAFGRYDPYKNLVDNINLPVTLLSRFDLLFIMKDTPNVEADGRLARHILTLHRTKATPEKVPITPEMFRKYLSYAKRFEPILSQEAEDAIWTHYMKMRSTTGTDSPIAITARQLEALVRLSEARARLFLRDTVTLEDANAIIRLVTISMQEVGVDVTTGKMDIDVIMSGTPQSMRDKIDLVIKTMRDLQTQFGNAMDTTLVTTAIANKQLLTEEEVHHTIQTLIKNGKIYEPAPGKISLIG
jgi:replicative DNA helicase Mcm